MAYEGSRRGTASYVHLPYHTYLIICRSYTYHTYDNLLRRLRGEQGEAAHDVDHRVPLVQQMVDRVRPKGV